MLPIFIIVYLVVFLPASVFCQDTIFINKHAFSTPVRNVFKAHEEVYVKTGEGLYKLENEKWVFIKAKFEKPFVFYDKGFYQTVFLPSQHVFDASGMSHLIPQKSITNSTMAQLDDRLFLSTGGSLFEYTISSYYEHYYDECSIRDIYLDDSLKVISTYSGIFINDTIKAESPDYSSGKFCKVGRRFYLCNDELYLFHPPDSFQVIPSGSSVEAGTIRKILEFKGLTYTLNSKSINIIDDDYQLNPVHKGYIYYDLEIIDNGLFFGTHTGEVFQYKDGKTNLLFKLDSKIRGIDLIGDSVFYSTDQGVYLTTKAEPEKVKQFADLPFSVKVVADELNNLWISTENGLYAIPYNSEKPVLFIPRVEFNMGALESYKGNIYAGSINGLYVIDIYNAQKFFSLIFLDTSQQRKSTILKWAGAFALLILILIPAFIYYRKKKLNDVFVMTSRKSQTSLTLDMIEKDITDHNIVSVEALAAHYNTNTVQLNRLFKSFETTPGKFIKKVKLRIAKELLQAGVPMEEVVARVGYSARLIESELHM